MDNLKTLYNDSLEDILGSVNLSNKMQAPKLVKVSINMGLGKMSDAGKDGKLIEESVDELSKIANQRAVATKAKKSEAGFKLREGSSIGARVTLRGNKMYEFLMKLLHLALPRVRDFRGISRKAFDNRGNYNLGIQDHLVFPEIDPTKTSKTKGMNITIVTTAQSDNDALILMEKLGFPFKKR